MFLGMEHVLDICLSLTRAALSVTGKPNAMVTVSAAIGTAVV